MSTRKQQQPKTTTPAALVYCGPTIRGVAKQFTIYTGGLPPALTEKAKAIPAINALTVSLEAFPAARVALSNPDSAEAAIFRDILKKL